jgi:hypothetical protein
MGYCTIADVQDEMGQTFSNTSRPNSANVEEAIDGVSGEIDGVLQATGYALPVTNLSALALLKRYTKFGAAAGAWHSGYVSDDEPARVTYWREIYESFIARLRRGEQQLPGEEISDDDGIAFAIAPHVQRDRYWLTGEALDA